MKIFVFISTLQFACGVVLLNQGQLNVSMTGLDHYRVQLEDVFSGDCLAYTLTPPPQNSGSGKITGLSSCSVTSFPYNNTTSSPAANSTFPCFLSNKTRFCVTFSSSQVKLFEVNPSEARLLWVQELQGEVEDVALLKQNSTFFLVASMVKSINSIREVLVWNVTVPETVSLETYDGEDLQGFDRVQLRVGVETFASMLLLFGRHQHGDRLNVYFLDPDTYALSLFTVIADYSPSPTAQSQPLSIIDVQVQYLYFLVLDAEAGVIRFSLVNDEFYSQVVGAFPGAGEVLGISNVEVGTDLYAIWTSVGIILSSSLQTEVLSYYPNDLFGSLISMQFLGRTLLVISQMETGKWMHVLNLESGGKARLQFYVQLNDTIDFFYGGLGGWYEPKRNLYYLLRDNGANVQLLQLRLRSPELTLWNTTLSYSTRLQAYNRLSGERSECMIHVSMLSYGDETVYYGSRYSITTTQPEVYKHEVFFTDGIARVRIPLSSLFSGPALMYYVTNQSISPIQVFPTSEVIERFEAFEKQFMLYGLDGIPTLGCVVSSDPVTFLAFSQSFIVLISVSETVTMRSIPLGLTPQLCVSYASKVWVYSNSTAGVYSIFELAISLNPMSMALLSNQRLTFPCMEMKANNLYLVCAGQFEIYVKSLYAAGTVIITSNMIQGDHLPLNIASSVLLGENNPYLALADVNNGLVVLDVEFALYSPTVLYFTVLLLDCCTPDTSLHFTRSNLIVIKGMIMAVFLLKDFELQLYMYLPPGNGNAITSVMLVDSLLYVNQGTFLNIYDMNATVHECLYVTEAIQSDSQFLAFPLSDYYILLALTPGNGNEYNFTQFLLHKPSEGATISLYLDCFDCLQSFPDADISMNMTVLATNLVSSATLQIEVLFQNKGTFPGVVQELFPPENATIDTDRKLGIPLNDVFKGNGLEYYLSTNVSDYAEDTSDLAYVTQGLNLTEEYYLSNKSCKRLVSTLEDSRVYCLYDGLIQVLQLTPTFNFTEEAEIPFAVTENPNCDSMIVAVWEKSNSLLVVGCTWSVPETIVTQHNLTFIVYHSDNSGYRIAGSVNLPQKCTYMKSAKSGDQELTIYCMTHSTIGKSYIIYEHKVSWTDDYQDMRLIETALFAPYNSNFSALRPLSMDVIQDNSGYKILVSDEKLGILMLESRTYGFNSVARILKMELDLKAKVGQATLAVCGNRLFVLKGSHVLVYIIEFGHFTWEKTIYPFNLYGTVAYSGYLYCARSNSSAFLVASISDQENEYLRFINYSASENSHIIADVQITSVANAPGGFLSDDVFVYFDIMISSLTVLKFTSPKLIIPKIAEVQFRNLTHIWGSNYLQVSVSAYNIQSEAVSPNSTFRRLFRHSLDLVLRERQPVTWWMALLWVLFLIVSVVVAVKVLKKYGKPEGRTISEGTDREMVPVSPRS